MSIDTIRATALALRKKYKSASPEEICRRLGVAIRYCPLDDLKGLSVRYFGLNNIIINNGLKEEELPPLFAHELGHVLLHIPDGGAPCYRDGKMFVDRDRCEYEANLFAAELLLGDREVLELMQEGRTFSQIAALLCVPPELLELKLRVLAHCGRLPAIR